MSEVPARRAAQPPDDDAPLVLTLLLDERSQAFFDDLRQRHFPPERNHLSAHVTLFHALPGARCQAIVADVDDVSRRPPFGLAVLGVQLLGRGVAYRLGADELLELRGELAARWMPWLGRQDRQPYRPHVTVQNKVTPERARRLHDELAGDDAVPAVTARGLLLWRYLGGPWALVHSAGFDPRAAQV